MKASRLQTVLQCLADGQFHSGEEIGELLEVSRSAVWKTIRQLAEYGIDVQRITGKGYCLPGGIEFFSQKAIINALSVPARQCLKQLDVLWMVDSTNHYLLEQCKIANQSGSVCVAEYQSAGRGRQGRTWVSPFGKNIYLSIAWSFTNGPAAVSGLSLVVGIAICAALQRYGVTDIGLKWPNDIYWRQQKLAGVLTEMFMDSVGVCHTVIGIGINLAMPEGCHEKIEQPWCDVGQIMAIKPSKNVLTAYLLEELLLVLPAFAQAGFTAYQERWNKYDILQGKTVTVTVNQSKISGVAVGIDDGGGLMVKCEDSVRTFKSGEVTVRQVNG